MNSLPYDDGEKSSRHTKRVLQLLGWRAQHVCAGFSLSMESCTQAVQ